MGTAIQNKQPKMVPPDYLWHVHYFRAFAIVCIVLVHSWVVPKSYESAMFSRPLDACRETLFHSSSIYFVFISGFLFFALSAKFDLRKYWKNKWSFVLCPYLVITTGLFLVRKFWGKEEFDGSFANYVDYLLWGKAHVQLWYIPFIAVVFLVSPWILKVPERHLPWLCGVSALLPLLGTRQGISPFGLNMLYFMPIFVVGYGVARYESAVVSMLKSWLMPIIIGVAMATSALFYLELSKNELRYEWGSLKESLYYLQKLGLSFLVMEFFRRVGQRKLVLMDQIAKASFGIYFLHPMLQLDFIWYRMFDFLAQGSLVLLFVVSFAYSLGVVYLCLATTRLLARLLGKKSRYLVGC